MIKAVFFDLYHTLVRYDPPREELQAKVLKDFGIEVKPELFRRPLVIADEFIYQEIACESRVLPRWWSTCKDYED